MSVLVYDMLRRMITISTLVSVHCGSVLHHDLHARPLDSLASIAPSLTSLLSQSHLSNQHNDNRKNRPLGTFRLQWTKQGPDPRGCGTSHCGLKKIAFDITMFPNARNSIRRWNDHGSSKIPIPIAATLHNLMTESSSGEKKWFRTEHDGNLLPRVRLEIFMEGGEVRC